MNIVEIAATDPTHIAFAPRTPMEEIMQNVRTILTTRRGSIPLDRDFGMFPSLPSRAIVSRPSLRRRISRRWSDMSRARRSSLWIFRGMVQVVSLSLMLRW